jgi:heme o synthase
LDRPAELAWGRSSRGSRRLHDYWQLTKPRIVAAIAFTALVGMLLAAPHLPRLDLVFFGGLGIWLAAASAAALNHVLDRRLDAAMTRTRGRPLPRGHLSEGAAVAFAAALAIASLLILVSRVNLLTAALTLASLIGYSVIYTAWLKHATPQNIVIGGAAGAAPPVLGWAAVTNSVDANALLLFLIVFTWTPPHFWALAIARRDEYERVRIPMLPVTHGVPLTCQHIVLYTLLLFVVTTLPYLTGLTGGVYLAGEVLLNAGFLYRAVRLKRCCNSQRAMRTFRYSIHYLLLLFTLLLVDHYFHVP